jgi:hypothetical protein
MILRPASRRVREAAVSPCRKVAARGTGKNPGQSPLRVVLVVNDVGGGIIDSQFGTTEFTGDDCTARITRGVKNLVPHLVTWSPGR